MGQFCLCIALTIALLIAPSMARAETSEIAKPRNFDTFEVRKAGTYDVVEEDFVFAKVGDLEIRAHSYRPKMIEPQQIIPAIVDVHGGAWNLYDRMAGALYDKALASAGVYVLAIDFRQGPQYKHPLGSRDSAAAVRYLRLHNDRLYIDSNNIGLVGSSSGAHLALLAGLLPNAVQHQGTPIVLPDGKIGAAADISADVNYIIALWPVSNPRYRFDYAKRVNRKELQSAHLNYFGDVDAMQQANVTRVLDEKEAQTPLPHLLVVQPGNDNNIPREMTFELLASYQNAGGQVEYAFFPGMPHAFAHRPSAATDDCIESMIDFIRRQNVVSP